MAAFTLLKSVQNLLVVGPIYNKLDKLKEIEKLLPSYDRIIFNDSITFGNHNHHSIKSQINAMEQLLVSGKVIYNVGNVDLVSANEMDMLKPRQAKIANWIYSKSNVVVADFSGSFRVIIVSGGIPSSITNYERLDNNVEVSFITHPHETYTGGLGYVIANLPLTREEPKYHRYSAQIGNDKDGQVYALEVDRNGVQRTILL